MGRSLTLCCLTLAVAAGCSREPPRPEHLTGLTAYSAQMHLHGLTHHNRSDRPASMQWHSHFAAQTGTDVLWWTDHAHGMDLTEDAAIDVRGGVLDRRTLEITRLDPSPRMLTRLSPEVTGGTANAVLHGDRLTMELQAGGDRIDGYDRFFYHPGSDFGRIRSTRWVRPVSSGLEVTGTLEVERINEDGRVEIEAHLSWHVRESAGQDTLRFRLHPTGRAAHARVVNEHSVEVDLPLPDGWRGHRPVPFALDLLGPASLLRWGDDNAVSQIAFGVAARRGRTVEVTFSDLRLHSRDPEPDHQIDRIETFARRYGEVYSITQHVGLEFGDLHTLDRPHMDGLFPGTVPAFDLLADLYRRDLPRWVSAVHQAGGLVTVNHIFGAMGREWRASTPAERDEKVCEVAARVLARHAYGEDLFEAGYLMRAGARLEDHLQVWDILLANGHRIYGDATSDCHGGAWGLEMTENPMATWIWAPDVDEKSLLDAMRRGRLFFGNPFLWSGELSIWVDGGWMGDEVAVYGHPMDLGVYLSPCPRTAEVFLVQGLLGEGTRTEYLHDRTPLDPKRPFSLETDRASFVRIEVYDRAAPDSLVPLAFSNPLFLVPPGTQPPKPVMFPYAQSQ